MPEKMSRFFEGPPVEVNTIYCICLFEVLYGPQLTSHKRYKRTYNKHLYLFIAWIY